jgi:hypothetical protein
LHSTGHGPAVLDGQPHGGMGSYCANFGDVNMNFLQLAWCPPRYQGFLMHTNTTSHTLHYIIFHSIQFHSIPPLRSIPFRLGDTWRYTSVQYHSMQYNTIQNHTTQSQCSMYSTKQSIPIHPNSTQWALIQSNTLHYNTIQQYTILYKTIPCHTITIQWNTMQYHTTRCSKARYKAI